MGGSVPAMGDVGGPGGVVTVGEWSRRDAPRAKRREGEGTNVMKSSTVLEVRKHTENTRGMWVTRCAEVHGNGSRSHC